MRAGRRQSGETEKGRQVLSKATYKEILEALRKDILGGRYEHALPSVGTLVRRFGVARATVQPPRSNCCMFTPKLSSVTVAANRNAKRLDAPSTQGAKAVEYSIWRVLTNDTLAIIEAIGDPASHMLGIMNCPAPE